ncbi:hypothetical protein F2981_15840 [Sinorhizobium meliloti]|nr:hypothetical protein [Sinorhizobium meliloti]
MCPCFCYKPPAICYIVAIAQLEPAKNAIKREPPDMKETAQTAGKQDKNRYFKAPVFAVAP